MARQGGNEEGEMLSEMPDDKSVNKTVPSHPNNEDGALPKKVRIIGRPPKKSHSPLSPFEYPLDSSCPCAFAEFLEEKRKLADDQRVKAYQDCTMRAQKFEALGAAALCRGKYPEAFSYFSQGIEHTKHKPELFTNRGAINVCPENFRRITTDCEAILYRVRPESLPSTLQCVVERKRTEKVTKKPSNTLLKKGHE